jgi:hypothetical protein
MTEPKQPRLKFEAIKTSMRQDGKGTYMTLTIHPDEVPIDLLSARPGTRYMVGMLPVDDHDRPVKGKDMEEGERAVQSAGMLCRNMKFQKWMVRQGLALDTSEYDCASGIKSYCDIESRSELKDNREARALFIKLRESFDSEIF